MSLANNNHSHYEQQQQQPQHAVHKFVSPFMDESNNNSHGGASSCDGMSSYHQQQGDNKMGLKAASVVSMDGTPDAHEYNPACPCASCQSLLNNFTSYDILDAYVHHHLGYEQHLQRTYGFVPCVGGPHGNVAVRLDPATGMPAEEAAPETSGALFFHCHLHTMKAVPADIKQRSLNRFYGILPSIAHHHSNHSNHQQQVAPQQYQHQQQHHQVQKRNYNNQHQHQQAQYNNGNQQQQQYHQRGHYNQQAAY